MPAKTVAEFIALLKANPTKYSFGAAGAGTSQHTSGELFKTAASVKMEHFSYGGSGPMLPELLGGTLQAAFDNIASAIPHMKAGKLRALAVTTTARSGVAPDVPTMVEASLAGYELSSWQSVFAPAGTPRPIVKRLNAEIMKILKSPEMLKRFGELGLDTVASSSAELAAVIKADVPRLGKVVKDSDASAN